MQAYVVICNYNVSLSLVDCVFQKKADAKAYAAALNGDKEKAVARCKVLIALHDSDGMASFLDGDTVSFEVVTAELK